MIRHEHLFQAVIAFQIIPAENPGIDSRDRGYLPSGAAGRKRPDQDRAVGIGAYEVLPVVRESALQSKISDPLGLTNKQNIGVQ